MCRDNTSSKDDIALYLRDLEKVLYGKEKVVIDGKIKSETQADDNGMKKIAYNVLNKTSSS